MLGAPSFLKNMWVLKPGISLCAFARGVFFRFFSWKFRVGPSQGSVAGRGVLKARTVIRAENVP